MAFVYALHASNEPGVIRYVGLTTQPISARLAQHKSHTNRRSAHKENWVRKVHRDGHEICCIVLEECDVSVVGAREQFWIADLRAKGVSLTNLCDGGEGHINPSPEARRKMGASKIGKKLTDEHKRKCSASLRGRKHSEETKAKISRSNLGRVHQPHVVAAAVAAGRLRTGEKNARFGKTLSIDTKRLLSEARGILSSDTVLLMRQSASDGAGIRDLATQFNVSYHVAYSIVKRITWKHLEDRLC